MYLIVAAILAVAAPLWMALSAQPEPQTVSQTFGAQPALTIPQGGTGTSTIPAGYLLTGGSSLRITAIGTTTLTASSPLSLSNPVIKVGGSNSVLTLDTSGTWTGNAGTASALAANAANCTAGSAAGGVTAAGAAEDCTDYWTEAENTAADYEQALTAGDALTRTGDDFDFDGGTAPGGSLGGTWASPTIDDLFILNTGDVGTGAYTFPYASSTAITVTGQIDFDSLTSALIMTGAGGVLEEYAGTSCTNQFPQSNSALGAWTCDSVKDEDIDFTDVTLADLTFDVGSVDTTEFGYLNGVTSAIQTQIDSKAAHATTLTVAGTTNQITSSAGAQDLSANRTWTLSLPSLVIFPSQASSTRQSIFDRLYVGGTATTTIRGDNAASVLPYASSTALSVSGTGYFDTASTTNLTVSSAQSGVLVTSSSGVVTASSTLGLNRIPTCVTITGSADLCDGNDATGEGGGSYPFTPTEHFGTTTSATTSPLFLRGNLYSGFASGTIVLTNASTTQLTISDRLYAMGDTITSFISDATIDLVSGALRVVDLICTDCINDTEIATHAGTALSADLEEEVTEGSLADSVIVSADIKDDTIVIADFADEDWGDITITTNAAAVEDDSHAHTATTISGLGTADISGLDISDDTNLTAGDNLTLTDDDLDLDTTLTGLTKITVTNASTTNFTATGYASTSNLTVSALGAADCDVKAAVGTGLLSCGTDGAGSGAWPFTPSAYAGVANQSTTTAHWFKDTMVIASTTLFTQASTTLFTADTAYINTIIRPDTDDGATLGSASFQWSDLFLANGGVIGWGGGAAQISASTGNISIFADETIRISAVNGIDLSGGDGILTLQGVGDGADESLTIDLDNGGANVITFGTNSSADTLDWDAFTLAKFTHASTTRFSAYGPAYFGGSATSSFDTAGVLTLATDLSVANGGTGASTLTGLLQGNGTSAFTAIADSSTVGQILRVTGASTYAWGALDLADGDAITGDLPFANLAQVSANSVLANNTSSTADARSVATSSLYTFSPAFSTGSSLQNVVERSFTYSTTTWTGTTTIPVLQATIASTFSGFRCRTYLAGTSPGGTVNIHLGKYTASTTMANASSTNGFNSIASNGTVAAGDSWYVDAGTPASSPVKLNCTYKMTI